MARNITDSLTARIDSSILLTLSPTISGWIQVKYGFQPIFAATLLLYIISIYIYWSYFYP